MLIFRKPIQGSTSYTHLQLVPKGFHDIVFIAFHSNPIGGHLNAYHTLHHLHLCYHWPEMYSFIKRLCNACPGCALSNPTCRYILRTGLSFSHWCSILGPLRRWLLCKHSGFEGSKAYLIAACGMTGFSVMEPIQQVLWRFQGGGWPPSD